MRHIALAFIMAATPVPVSAQSMPPEAEQRQACMGDAFRLCAGSIPDRAAVATCMTAQHDRLSPSCRNVLDVSRRAQMSSDLRRP